MQYQNSQILAHTSVYHPLSLFFKAMFLFFFLNYDFNFNIIPYHGPSIQSAEDWGNFFLLLLLAIFGGKNKDM